MNMNRYTNEYESPAYMNMQAKDFGTKLDTAQNNEGLQKVLISKAVPGMQWCY